MTSYRTMILMPLAEIETLWFVLGGRQVILVFNEFSR